MKSLILLTVAAALVSASAAEAKGIRIRIGGPRATVTAPKPATVPQQAAPRQAVPQQASSQQALPQQIVPRRAGVSGGVFVIPGRAPAAGSSDQRRGLQSSDWQIPEARQATPDWFKAAANEAARGASQHEPSAAAPPARKAAFQCAPERLVGGFCMLN